MQGCVTRFYSCIAWNQFNFDCITFTFVVISIKSQLLISSCHHVLFFNGPFSIFSFFSMSSQLFHLSISLIYLKHLFQYHLHFDFDICYIFTALVVFRHRQVYLHSFFGYKYYRYKQLNKLLSLVYRDGFYAEPLIVIKFCFSVSRSTSFMGY